MTEKTESDETCDWREADFAGDLGRNEVRERIHGPTAGRGPDLVGQARRHAGQGRDAQPLTVAVGGVQLRATSCRKLMRGKEFGLGSGGGRR